MGIPRARTYSGICVPLAVLLWTGPAPAQELTRDQKEAFLRTAKVVNATPAGKFDTDIMRATLKSEDGSMTHDALIHRIDEKKNETRSFRIVELNFRNSYQFDLAAYKLALLLGLDMVPPHVERAYGGDPGSFSWWVDDVIIDNGERQQKKMQPPDRNDFNAQYSIVQVFDQLIYNTYDRNHGDLLITKDWKLWMIDHTHAFRLHDTLQNPKILKMCEIHLLARLKSLNEPTLKQELGAYLTGPEIQSLLKRRDLIVAHFATAGQSALYSYTGRCLPPPPPTD